MTSIHAPVPQELSDPVKEAKLRGEDAGAVIQELEECTRIPRRPQKESRVHSLRMKKKPDPSQHNHNHQPTQENNTLPTIPSSSTSSPFDDEDENHPSNANANTSATKENDPSLSPSPVKLAPPSPRKSALGKRPLSVLSITPDPDPDFDLDLNHPNREEEEDGDNDGGSYMTASEKNIAANNDSPNRDDSPTRKSPKLSSSSSFSRGARPRANDEIRIFEDNPEPMICATAAVPTVPAGYGGGQAPQPSSHPVSGSKISREPPGGLESGTRAGVGSSSSSSSGPSKRKPRVGIRRL